MTLKTLIRDGQGTGNLAGVSNAGELVVTGFGNNQSNNQSMTVNGQVYNFFPPLAGQTFVITTIIFSVSGNTTLTIFSAPSATSTTKDTVLFTSTMPTAQTLPITLPFGGFIAVGEGEFLNATTNSAPSQMTIIGFYRPVIII